MTVRPATPQRPAGVFAAVADLRAVAMDTWVKLGAESSSPGCL
jgi:hypothetical protein